LLEVEIATITDWGRPFVTATYSDCPLALHCYEKIETIKAAIHTAHTPNLDAVARQLSTSAERSLLQRAFPSSHSYQHLQTKELFSMVQPVCNLV